MTATCRGIDVSAYQGAQNWAAHKAGGVVFAFAKASEGQHSRDSGFEAHITGIRNAGLVPGAYHFAWPNQPAAVEAGNYIAAVKPYAGPGFTHWLDLEAYPDNRNYAGKSAADIRAYVVAWLGAVERAFPGQRVGVYTSATDLGRGHVPAAVPLWYPAYPGSASDTYAEAEQRPQPEPSGRAPLIWQFTGTPQDRSICYLSAAGLRAWARGTTEDDDMPQFVNLGIAAPYTLAPGQDWDAIEFTTEWTDETGDHGEGGSQFVKGPARFTGQVSLALEGVPVGEQVQVRLSEVDSDGDYVKDHPIAEVVGTEGGTYAVVPITNRAPAGRGMRVRVKGFQDTPITVTSVVLKALVWKE